MIAGTLYGRTAEMALTEGWLRDIEERGAEMGFELGPPDAVRRLVDEAERLGPAPLDRTRITWLREIVDDGVPGDPIAVERLVAAADEAVAVGDRSLALNLLHGAALRCWWADPGAAARELVIKSVDRIVEDRSEPRALEIMSLAAPVDRGAFVAQGVALSASRTAHDPAMTRLLGMTAHAVGDYGPAVDLLSRAAPGLRDQGRLGLLAQLLIVHAWGCIHVGKFGEAARDLDKGDRLAVETEPPIWINGAKIGRALLAGVRGEEEVAEDLAREAEAAVLPLRLGDLLAVLQLGRGLAALSAGRHSDAYDHLPRVFDPTDPAFNELESYAAVGYLAEAAVHAGRRDEARYLLARPEHLDNSPVGALAVGAVIAAATLVPMMLYQRAAWNRAGAGHLFIGDDTEQHPVNTPGGS